MFNPYIQTSDTEIFFTISLVYFIGEEQMDKLNLEIFNYLNPLVWSPDTLKIKQITDAQQNKFLKIGIFSNLGSFKGNDIAVLGYLLNEIIQSRHGTLDMLDALLYIEQWLQWGETHIEPVNQAFMQKMLELPSLLSDAHYPINDETALEPIVAHFTLLSSRTPTEEQIDEIKAAIIAEKLS